jgi:hypothetical protein
MNSIQAILLEPEEYFFLKWRMKNLGISQKGFVDFYLQSEIERNNLTISEIYFAAKLLFGESSDRYDDFKSSYTFPFLLIVKKNGVSNLYIMNFRDYSTSINFSFDRLIIGKKFTDKDPSTYHDPIEDEFSLEEINIFQHKFISYLIGIYKGYQLSGKKIKDFTRVCEKPCAIYGFSNQESFFDIYEGYDELYEAIKELEKDAKRKKIPFNATKKSEEIDCLEENIITIQINDKNKITFGTQDHERIIKYNYSVSFADEFLKMFKDLGKKEKEDD